MDQWPKLRERIYNKLQDVLEDVSSRVHYQPPTGARLTYPCVVCRLDDMPSIYADNDPYHSHHVYKVTVIDRDPMSVIREKIAELPATRFERYYETDNLNHYVFRSYV